MRPRPAACDDDAGAAGLGAEVPDRPGPARILRVSRGPDGAVGRPGGAGVLGRRAGGRHAGPQRTAAGPLHDHPRRTDGAGLGNGGAGPAGRCGGGEGGAAAGRDDPGGPVPEAGHQGRRAQDRLCPQEALPPVGGGKQDRPARFLQRHRAGGGGHRAT